MPIWFTCFGDLVRGLGGCRRGNSAVEFGLAAPFLILLALGAFDYGSAYVESIRLNGAARAGAQQSLYDTNAWQDTTLAEQMALEEYVGHALAADEIAALSVTATATAFCACTAGATVACSATCAGGASPGQFVRVRLNRAVPLTMPYPWEASDEVTVDGQAVVRVR